MSHRSLGPLRKKVDGTDHGNQDAADGEQQRTVLHDARQRSAAQEQTRERCQPPKASIEAVMQEVQAYLVADMPRLVQTINQ